MKQSRPNRGATRAPETRSTREARDSERDKILRNLGLDVAKPTGRAEKMSQLVRAAVREPGRR